MNDIDNQFIKLHNVENVNMITCDGIPPIFTIKFLDGREIKQEITNSDYDKIINTIKETIVENSILTIRKRKLNKLCGHITEEKPKS